MAKSAAKPPAKASPKASKSTSKAEVANSKTPAVKKKKVLKALPASEARAEKPKKIPKATPAAAPSSAIVQLTKDASEAIGQLASDILADRIIPTIEQIKAVAAHALGKAEPDRPKRKSKKK